MKRTARILLWIFIIFLVLMGSLYFGSQPMLKRILDGKLKDTRIAGLYKVEVRKAYFDLFNLGLSFKEVKLSPDSTSDAFKVSPQLATLKINRVSLSYLNIWKFIQDNTFQTGKIKIIEPELNLYFLDRPPLPAKGTQQTNADAPIIQLDGLEIKRMQLKVHLKNASVLMVDKLNFNLHEPEINTALLNDVSKAISYKDISLQIESIRLENPDIFYHINLKEIKTKDNLSQIILKGLKIDPKYDKKTFAEKHNYQIDRFQIELDQIALHHFNLKRLFEEKVIELEEIDIEGLNMEVYRDKDHPFNFQKYPKLPQEQIRNINQNIEIQQININDAQVVYLEHVEGATKSGRVDFKKMNAQIQNFGNTKLYQQEREMKVDMQCKLYGKAHLSAQLNFPLGSNTFYVSGSLEKSPMYIFNDITVTNAGVKIDGGEIDRLSFNFKADRKSSAGELLFLYHDLEIDLLKEEDSGEVKERKFLNLLINNLVLPKQNPNHKGEEYKAVIAFDRDLNKGVFNYLWKSVFTGIKDTFKKEHKDIQDYTIEKQEEAQNKKEMKRKKREERKNRKK